MAKFTAIEPLLLKSGRVEPGEVVDLSDTQASPLLALGAIKPAQPAKPAKAEPATKD